MILTSNIRKRVVIEMACDFGWHKYAGLDGKVISVNQFGASAPASIVIEKYGFTVDHIVETYLSL